MPRNITHIVRAEALQTRESSVVDRRSTPQQRVHHNLQCRSSLQRLPLRGPIDGDLYRGIGGLLGGREACAKRKTSSGTQESNHLHNSHSAPTDPAGLETGSPLYVTRLQLAMPFGSWFLMPKLRHIATLVALSILSGAVPIAVAQS